MSVISATPLYSEWTGSDIEAVEPWQVVTDSTATSAPEVTGSSLLPSVGDRHIANFNLIVKQGGIVANRLENNGKFWNVTVTYSQEDYVSDGRLLRFSVGTQTYSKPITECYEYTLDIDSDNERHGQCGHDPQRRDRPIVNSAKDNYDAADLVGEEYNVLLTWTQVEDSGFDYAAAVEHQGSVNEADVTVLGITVPAERGLLRKINSTAVIVYAEAGDEVTWHTDYEVEITTSSTGHDLRMLDVGLYARFTAEGAEADTHRAILMKDVYTGDGATAREKKQRSVKIPQALDGGSLMTQTDLDSNKGPYSNRYRTQPFVNWNDELDLLSARIDS